MAIAYFVLADNFLNPIAFIPAIKYEVKMNLIEREEKRRELKAKIKKWPSRLRKLAKRKEDPLSERAFCLKHGLPVHSFNRAKNLRAEPREKKVNEVEKALEAEGV